ncbi:MAG: class I SAM-dependent methyltransferase [Cyanobacteriota bacterium]|nr:class I SAM-dependent methyltransferase [Cyanobacteriota bacterium]
MSNSENPVSSNALFFGRTLAEYLKMFDLDISGNTKIKILDCPSGPASFVAEATRQGIEVVGCDPVYSENEAALRALGTSGVESCIKICQSYSQYLSEKFYPSLQSLESYSQSALQLFLEDYEAGIKEGRYVKASLPTLPFADASFNITLSANFLFVYFFQSEETALRDYEFHLSSILELMRVSQQEVRIFPFPNFEGLAQSYAQQIISELEARQIKVEIKPVEYEVMKGGNLMLRLLCEN